MDRHRSPDGRVQHPRHRRVRLSDVRDAGYAAVLSALILVPLLGFAGFAVDIGAWYSRASAMQRAADAAALAGVVWQPDFTTAQSEALAAAARNGFVNGVDGVTVTVIDDGPNQIEVQIRDDDVELYFAGLFLDGVTIERSATSEYVKSVPMGSPENFLGNDPINGDSPNLWLATFGPQTEKRSGDRYHTEVCGGAIFCTGNVNDEFAPDGYFFTLDVRALGTGNLNVQLFDAVHHDYGDYCDASFLYNDGTVGAQPWYTGALAAYPQERYEKGGAGNPGGAVWCPGDNGLVGNFEMTVIVREPDGTPFDSTDNPVACWTRWGNAKPSSQADFAARLQNTTTLDQPKASAATSGNSVPAANSIAFPDYFREWVNVCSITSPVVGQYIVQIRTNASTANPLVRDASITTQGRNRYSMKAGFGASTSAGFGSNVSISADGRLPMFVNVPPGAPSTCSGSPTCFYIARVQPEWAGQQLQLDVFDLTDGSDINVTFLPPSESGLGTFSSCDFIFYPETGGSVDLSESNCTATYAANNQLRNGGSNGDSIAAIIDIPVGYTCNEADPFGCWVTAQMTFNGTPSDTTTWSAEVTGDPIRLVE